MSGSPARRAPRRGGVADGPRRRRGRGAGGGREGLRPGAGRRAPSRGGARSTRSSTPAADVAFAVDIELIYEGYLLHYRESRALALAPGDLETRLLAGDCFYARGLRGIAARGDADAVGLLARLMAACSYLRSAGAPFAADDALWAYTTAGLVAAARRRRARRRVAALFDDVEAGFRAVPPAGRAGRGRAAAGASRPVGSRAAAARARSRRREVTVDLRAFISLLEREGELARVRPEVDPYLEMAEIADRASKAHGPAVLFEQPKRPAGQPAVPVLMNQLGSYRRLELALGAPLDDIAKRIGGLLELQVPSGLVGKVKALGQLKELASYGPRYGKKPLWREVVVDPPDLARLPVLTTWPGDGGPFITLPIVVTKDQQGRQNAGMYRLQVFDGQTTGMHIHIHHDGAANFREAGDRMEVAVALGTDPAVTYAATAPLPPGISEFMFAGFLRGEPVDMAPCATVDLAGAGRRRDRPRGLRREGRDAARGAVRRPHRLLLPGGPVPGVPPHGHEPPPRPHLPGHHRRQAADGGRLPRQGHRAPLPAAAAAGPARDRRHGPAHRGRLPRLRHHQHPQGVPGPRAQDHERRVGHGADDVHQVRGRRGRARRRARLQRGHLAGVQQRRPGAGHGHRARPARRARPLEPLRPLRRQDGHRRHQDVARRRARRASGRTSSPWTRPSSRRVDERWKEFGLPFS